jgi:AcrR family transcriptional regulator
LSTPAETRPRELSGAEKTRQDLMEAALAEFRAVGYRSASLRNILARVGVTKGALYHHFASKQALGYAVVDEIICGPMLDAAQQFQESQDPLTQMQDMIRQQLLERLKEEAEFGCPFHLIAQEMAPQDEGFRQRIQAMYAQFHEALRQSLERAQGRGQIDARWDPSGLAALMISNRNGLMGMARHCPNRALVVQATETYLQQLEAMRASTPAKEHL